MCDTLNQGFERNGTYIPKFHCFKVCKTKPVENSVTSTRCQGFYTTLKGWSPSIISCFEQKEGNFKILFLEISKISIFNIKLFFKMLYFF